MNAVMITTAGDLSATLVALTGKGEPVLDKETGEPIGWIRETNPGWWEWFAACQARGEVRSPDVAKQRIEEAIADSRRVQDWIEREIAHLPESLQTLRLDIEEAKTRREIERHRKAPRSEVLAGLEEAVRRAELAYAAAERALADAA